MRRRKLSLYEAFSSARLDARPVENGTARAEPTPQDEGRSRRETSPPRLSLHLREAPRTWVPRFAPLGSRSLVWIGGTVLAVSGIFYIVQRSGGSSAPEELALSAPTHTEPVVPPPDPDEESAARIDGVTGVQYALRVGSWAGNEVGEQRARDLIAELQREGYPVVQGLVLQKTGECRVYVGESSSPTDPILADLHEKVVKLLRESVLADPAQVVIEPLPTIVR